MKKILKNLTVLLPAAVAAAMFFLLPRFPVFTEYVVSRGLFRVITVPVGFITSLLPISLTELLVILALPLLILLIILLIHKLRRSREKRKILAKAGMITAWVLSCASLTYMICHGANYYRLPLEQIMELDTSQKTAEDLHSACIRLARGAAEARSELGIADDEPYVFAGSVFTELSRTNSGYKPLVEEYPMLWSSVLRQKPVMLSEAWSYTGITGMYFPFFVESNVNTAQPDYAVPFTAAHESAHSRGIAFENDCNFLAFLSCINSEYPEFRYSGYMEAFKYCSNALWRYDRDMWAETREYCTQGMIIDFVEYNDYVDRHEGKTMEVSHEINDTFITVQGVPDGALSYDRVTALILAYYQKNP